MTTRVPPETVAIPASHLDLLTRPICGVLTTMGNDGQPQSSLVWVDVDPDGACAQVNTTLDWPACAGCGNRMEHLLTVESTEADAVSRRAWTPVEERHTPSEGPGLVLGDLGGVYFFECHVCPGRPFTHRYDCP